ncbi:hypothetical protein ISO99_03390 [Staphylococcus sp. 18_1_E_LY]|uniref:Uncharacterized protein n=1 Tax=Staphylococcus lloydii TaxID=2781774 RepID=A0A7T1AYA1_9STAP|nr:hypothetical protein [Staphylococcus lloydii]MBF7018948.1 hypothetical protein [Staphylococcus lloydii]MBF7026676.1 hypothetical protein [Staphylococcus lloydii]QPM74337.1 hypothetical protein ISP08_08250 [Staphylococcus lloydii]
MTYINFWKRAFDFKGTAKVIDFITCLFVNFFIALCIMISGFLVPFTWENAVVNLYYIVLLLMLVPTVSMFVRVIRTFVRKSHSE